MWIGLDDTDGPTGGCTTHLLTEVVAEAESLGVDLIGYPRLVRLNPNVPFKTRGNAALSARFGRGSGGRFSVGERDGRTVWAYRRGRALADGPARELFDAVCATVDRGASPEPGTDPAVVMVPRRLPASLYWEAVCRLVTVDRVLQLIDRGGGRRWTRADPRGLVGAASAVAWPGGHPTFELLAYRHGAAVGTPREVDPASVRRVARRFPELFQCVDDRTRRVLVAPHTACPILYGLRAARPDRLARAARAVRSEPVARWMVFASNQGTGDHLVRRRISSLEPFDAARLRATVREAPRVGPGGHVQFTVSDGSAVALPVWAFEPTKTLPSVVRRLTPGDRVELWGGRGADPAFRLEGLAVLRLAPRTEARGPPSCPVCGRATHSAGAGRGYRCRRCRQHLPPEYGQRRVAAPAGLLGLHLPTPSARRHLAPRGPPRRPAGAGGARSRPAGSDL